MVRDFTSTLYAQNAVMGLPKKEATFVTENDPLILEFSRRPSDGGIVAFGGRGKPRSFRLRFRSAALTLFGQVYVFYSAIRQQVPKPM